MSTSANLILSPGVKAKDVISLTWLARAVIITQNLLGHKLIVWGQLAPSILLDLVIPPMKLFLTPATILSSTAMVIVPLISIKGIPTT